MRFFASWAPRSHAAQPRLATATIAAVLRKCSTVNPLAGVASPRDLQLLDCWELQEAAPVVQNTPSAHTSRLRRGDRACQMGLSGGVRRNTADLKKIRCRFY